MAQKVINVPDIGAVTFQKRAGTRSLRLHIQGSRVKVTLPTRVPYAYAEKFLQSRKQWILENIKPISIILDGAYIGKNHRVAISYKDITRPSSRVSQSLIAISLPTGTDSQGSEAQRIVIKACEKALVQETTDLVIPRLQDLAYEHEFDMKSASVKRLRSRWGSCDSHKNIVLNSYLAQLPWPLIDYVLIHELAHTRHLNHSAAFWEEVKSILPDYKALRKATKAHSPHVITT
jgi:predicted metal-dependent hydrolase